MSQGNPDNIVEISENGGQTLILKINRPKVYNALTKDAKLELISLIRKADRNPEVRTLILTGEGKAFCTGQDLNDRTVRGDEAPVDLGTTLETEWNPLVNAIRECSKPVIAAVNGVCAGAGVSVALACDLIIAESEAKFVSGFTKLGLIPDAGSSHKFARAMGQQKAFEFFVFNRALMPEHMEEYGLINGHDERPLEVCLKWAASLNKMAPLSLSTLKTNLQQAQDLPYNEMLDREIAAQRTLGNSLDYKEGLSAFFEKREPQFKGQ